MTHRPVARALSAEERERLILEHLPQVRLIARRIQERVPGNVTFDDLVSAGVVGLISAIDHFDRAHNVKLKTYAEYRIRGAILDSLRDLDWAPRRKRRMARQIDSATRAASQRLRRDPTEEEIAQELDLDLNQYHQWLAGLQGLGMGALESASEAHHRLACAPDDDQKLPLRLLERHELEKLLAEAIAHMPPMDRTVVRLYLEDLNLREIAQLVHLHPSRISQLKSQAIVRLRAYFARRWPVRRGV